MTRDINLAKLMPEQGFSIIGTWTSCSVSDAGDFNGDSFADFIIGALSTVYVIYGSVNLTTIDLANLTPTQGISITTNYNAGKFGSSVSGAGDINNDGYDDVIISNPGSQSPGQYYIVYGGNHLLNIRIDSNNILIDRNNLIPFSGIIFYEEIFCSYCKWNSYSVSGAGDVNGDGFADIIIIAASDYNKNKINVVYGGANLVNSGLNYLPPAKGFSITGDNYLNGCSVSSAGDINNDGKADIIIGLYMAAYHLEEEVGTSYVIYGGDNLSDINLASLTTAQGFSISGAHSGDNSGSAVAGIGDINGDGISDIIIGAPVLNKYFSTNYKGVAYVIYGNPSLTNIDLANLNPSQGFSIIAPSYGDQLGYAVASAGDINGDGMSDIIIGAPMSTVYTERGSSEKAGISYVVYGAKSLTDINLANLNKLQGFSIAGKDYIDQSGYSVSGIGDVNRDGYDDVIIGSRGIAYVIYGNSSATEVSSLTPTIMPTIFTTTALTSTPTTIPNIPPTIALTITPTISSITPSMLPTLSSAPSYFIVEIKYGGSYTYNDITARENFIIDSPTNTLITGGSGADKFTILPHAGVTTTITNFDSSDEIIDLSNFADIQSINDFAITYKSATIVNLPNGEQIKLLNVMSEDIVAGNFIFSSITIESNDNTSKLSYGTILGIFTGGAILLSTIGYIAYAKIFNLWPFIQAISEEVSKGQYSTIELVENVLSETSQVDLTLVGDALETNV